MLSPPSCEKICTVTGPTPYSVGIVAKDKCNIKSSSNTRQRIFGLEAEPKSANDAYCLQVSKQNFETNFKRDWDKQLKKKIVGNEARREFNNLANSYQDHLEERKFKLFKLLEEEEDGFITEMESASRRKPVDFNDILDKINCFKQERDERRREIVKEKLNLKFMYECQELRPKLSAQLAEAVLADRREQVREHEGLKKMKKLEEEYYNCLWHADYLNKLHKEEQKAIERHARNMDTLITLNTQMTAKQIYKDQVAEMEKQEAKLMAEHRQQMELEKKQEKEKQLEKKKELKAIIEANIAQSEKNRNELKCKEKDFDCFYKNFFGSADKSDETSDKIQRLKEAQDNLKQVLTEKNEKLAREMESDRLIQLDNDKLWGKYNCAKELEEEKRKKLLDETMNIRKIQVQEKISENEKQQLEIKKEVEAIREMIEFNKKMVIDEEERHKTAVKSYKESILRQIDVHKAELKAKRDEMRREFDVYCVEEEEYRKKLQATLQNVDVGKLHPMRLQAAVATYANKHGETDTMAHMKMRISQMEQTIKNKKSEISEKTTQGSQKMEQFNNILSYYNPED